MVMYGVASASSSGQTLMGKLRIALFCGLPNFGLRNTSGLRHLTTSTNRSDVTASRHDAGWRLSMTEAPPQQPAHFSPENERIFRDTVE
jgi:hypothetical protein